MKFIKHKLGRRIVAYMILASAVFSVFAAAFQLLTIYENGLDRVRDEFSEVEGSFQAGLESALWEFNFSHVDVLVDGIYAQHDVIAVTLVAETGQRFERGAIGSGEVLVEEFPLSFERSAGDVAPVGILRVTASLENVYDELWSQVMVLLLTNFVKTLIASLIMFWIFDRMVSRHLLSITGRLQEKGGFDAEKKIVLDRPKVYNDELDLIVDVINTSRATEQSANAETLLLRNRLETVLNTATSGIIALNANAEVVMVNPTARHLLGGVSRDVPFAWPESIQFLDVESMTPLDASADPIRRALTGHNLRAETHLLSRVNSDEVGRYVRVQSGKLEHARDDISTVLVVDDVSVGERNRQVVERKSRLDALGQLTGGIAHDFNNLLASMLYAVDLARRQEDKERQGELLDIASASIGRGRELTSRLLAFAKKQPGLATSRSIGPMFEEFEKLVGPMIEQNLSITFVVDAPDLQVYCDHAQLETALMNLVLNSRDAILRSGVGHSIKVHARSVSLPQPVLLPTGNLTEPLEVTEAAASAYRYTEISVTDNGPGMDEETRARAADPFFTTKETNSGTGLGLSIVYGFVRQADGDLRIYSEEGVGTTINLVLPRGTEAGPREDPMPLDVPMAGTGQTVMLVEDEADLLNVMVEVIKDLGFLVVSAPSGNVAIDMIDAGQNFDVLLTDVVMPGKIGGFELARMVRARHPEKPVIYMSGYTGFTSQEMGEVQAMLLQKPTPPVELSAALNAALAPVPKPPLL
ncbi:Blue-light-activated protein [Ascidiaceihabitans donghaensis]|uniref:histidine kinase n=1 Tax=Ascidiaceihabitans donghaensis TaxID=1510460 RepID=A0A2R8BG37_9RHOB|nr:ATP-binding protein [Ascidiaceihabitans donghaensis]SPH22048.1 Blue-light-activated protein [Ascidiaceihabitans donghaensis]